MTIGSEERNALKSEVLNETIKRTETEFIKGLDSLVDKGMEKHPSLAWFVKRNMKESLTTPERALMADTCLVVYKVLLEDPPEKNEQLKKEFEKDFDGETTLDGLCAVNEDEIYSRIQGDNNKIFQLIQEGMGKDGQLATYVAMRLRESVNLEGATLVGTTALSVYSAFRTHLQITA